MKTNNIKISHINMRSMNTGFYELKSKIQSGYHDIILISETWINTLTDINMLKIENYSFINRNRTYGRGGGVAAYVKNNIKFSILDFDL